MDTRTRRLVGLLICLVIGLGIALIIVAGDDSNDPNGSGSAGRAPNPATERLTEPTATTAPPATSTTPSGGTPVPGGTTTSAGGEGGL